MIPQSKQDIPVVFHTTAQFALLAKHLLDVAETSAMPEHVMRSARTLHRKAVCWEKDMNAFMERPENAVSKAMFWGKENEA